AVRVFFFSSRRRHTSFSRDWSSDVCSSDLAPGFQASPLPVPQAHRPLGGTRIDLRDQSRSIGTQIAAIQKGFLPYDQVSSNPEQLAQNSDRLRPPHNLSREIARKRDLESLPEKILRTFYGCV